MLADRIKRLNQGRGGEGGGREGEVFRGETFLIASLVLPPRASSMERGEHFPR